jgi:hypothetical protein
MTRKRASLRATPDVRVPVVGERLKIALEVMSVSEKQAAVLLGERNLARISQPALNNICNGKTRSCRLSVRNGLAELSEGLVTSEWLGGVGGLEEWWEGEDWRERGTPGIRMSGLRQLTLLLALARAWKLDNPATEFPVDLVGDMLADIIDPTFYHVLLMLGVDPQRPATQGQLTYEQQEDFSRHIAGALWILLRPWLEEDGRVNWPAILRLAQLLGRFRATFKARVAKLPPELLEKVERQVAIERQSSGGKTERKPKRPHRKSR